MDEIGWGHIKTAVDWLDKSNGVGPEETALRLLKLSEEVGEVADAYIGMVGQNPRKGVTHTKEDVATELCDVVITALVAMHDFTSDPEEFFNQALAARNARLRKMLET